MNAAQLDVVRQDYLASLAELKDTSRPAIMTLTSLAAETAVAAPAVVAAIVERSFSAAPPTKLPVMYLIDSILKNVGGPYPDLFAKVILGVYQDAFLASDDRARQAFLKVLHTWRNPPPPPPPTSAAAAPARPRGPLFPPAVLDQIDAFVRSVPRPVAPTTATTATAMTSASSAAAAMAAAAAASAASAVNPADPGLVDLNTLIEARTVQAHQNPLDVDNIQKLDALMQLRSLILAGHVPPQQMDAVRQSIAVLAHEFFAALAQQQQQQQLLGALAAGLPLPAAAAAGLGGYAMPAVPLVVPPLVVPLPGTAGVGAVAPRAASPPVVPAVPRIEISLTRLEPDAVKYVYPADSKKCTQCGLRFLRNGPRRMDDHMDWHFRMNRKARDNTLSIRSRLWLPASREARFSWRYRRNWLNNERQEASAGPSFFDQVNDAAAAASAASAASTDGPTSSALGNTSSSSTSTTAGAAAGLDHLHLHLHLHHLDRGSASDSDDGTSLGGDDASGARILAPASAAARHALACAVCLEKIDSGYDADADEWIVKDAVAEPVAAGSHEASDGSGGSCVYYHRRCWRSRAKRSRKRTASPIDDASEMASDLGSSLSAKRQRV
ncbi:mRNA 3' end processing factor [Blastocladiella emersonii ATCC 22665]|nr:mRNA 3' end processing factor [Blastocladiella emersonii ATCC 22665]